MKFLTAITAFLVIFLITGCGSSQDVNSPQSDNYTNSNGEPVDTNSREYITGLTIGSNFSEVSNAGLSAEDVCIKARDQRLVVANGIPSYVQPKTISFLETVDGMQGCIDGFNGIPQD